MTAHEVRSTIVNISANLLFVAICCGVVGGGIEGLRGQNFNIPERVRALEIETGNYGVEITLLRQNQRALNDSVSELHGIGIAVGGALGVLQLISMAAAWTGRKKTP